nr:translation initiation factor IF-2-like [Pongo abelii]
MKCLSLPLNVNKISVTRIYLALCNCLLKQSSPTLNNHLNKRFLNKSIRSEWSIPTKPIPIEDHTKWDFSERSLQRYSRPGGRASSGADGRVKAARGGEQADSSPSFRGACGAGTGDRHNQRVRAGPTAVTGLQGGRMVAACPLPEPPFSQQRTEGARTGKNKGRGARDPRGRRWVWGRRPGAGAAGRAGPAAAGGVRREAGCVGRAAARGSGRGVWTSECAPVRRRGALAAALPAPSRGASEPAWGREKPWGAQSGSGEAGRGAHAAVGLGLLGIRTGVWGRARRRRRPRARHCPAPSACLQPPRGTARSSPHRGSGGRSLRGGGGGAGGGRGGREERGRPESPRRRRSGERASPARRWGPGATTRPGGWSLGNESEVISDFSPGKKKETLPRTSAPMRKSSTENILNSHFPRLSIKSGKKQRDDTTEVSGKLRLIKGILLDMQAL